MGVPKFFRYISERYPCLWELIKEHQIPEFDYLYLDMNGIIHTCSHPNDSDVSFRITEENIFKNIFHYIEVLFNMIRPKKLFFMAIDGVAPRAKINQQRGRRFRAAKDAEVQENKAMQKGITLPTEKRFDSNCITPGTFFMAKLGKQLKRFIEHKISIDDGWKRCKVMFSGCEVPGEGEHKIMDYIRFMKASEDYDCNSRHCLYGLDADLIMLGLCSHEPNFSLLREEVKFGKQHTTTTPERTKFCLLHLSLLREYIEHEFSPLKDKLPFPFDIEKIIDDWVLMGFLVGNDFIPHLPNLHINRGALPILYRAYMEVLPTLKGYINESGTLNLEHFEKFMEKLGSLDVEQFKEHYADLKYFESKTGRKLNETERHVYKKLEDGEIASPKRTNKDLDALIKSTTEMCLDNSDDDDDDFMMDMDMIDDESDSEVYTMEFVQHKRDYYMNKLEYDNVDAEVLRSQAEGYVRAIQWNLHYYYHGCCSWSWYYPHHYAPYISDIKDFKNLKLEFELGEPFLPFQQLLAVLPAYSKDLLPVAFQSLLTEDSSPIISYYPNNFKTDLNGKQQEWEAVVLIPFIDEKLLLAAMEPHLSKLTAEEQARNRHGPMCLYSYTEETRNVYQETMYFSQFTSHAQVQLLNRDDIFVPREKLVRGLSPGFDCSLYYPGFPTMRHLRHTAHLEKAKVRVFQQTSSGDNMILRLESEETPNLETLASELLGKSVYVGWPNLKEALCVSASDCKMRITLINHLGDNNPDNLKKESMKNIQDWNAERKTIKETHMSRHGIDIGETSVLLHARLYLGNKYVFDDQGKVTMEKQWSDLVISYAYQTIVTDVSTFRVEPPAYESVHNIFTPGTFCFMLGHPYYGAMGEVVQNKDNQKRRIKVSMKIAKEPIFDHVKQAYMQQKTRYMHGSTAAQRLGISSHLLSRITGTIYVIQAANEEFVKHNVGLNLKFNKKNEEVTGYTRKDNGQWLYSPKAVQLIRAYMARCPELFSRLHQNVMSDIFQEEELFGTANSKELQETVAWLKEELRGMGSRTCGMDALEPDLVKQIEEEVDKYLKSEDSKAKSMFMQVKPQLLFKPGLHLPSVPPDPNSQNRLFDRICCVRNGFTVPLGAKGTIIGTRKNATDTVYDVLFDTPFIGGLTLNGCSEFRGYHLTATDFINISFGERTEQGSATNELTECRKQTIPTTAIPSKKIDKVSHTQMQLAKKGLEKLSRDIRISMMQRGEVVSNTKMAPQHLQGASVPAHNQSSEFQALWDELHKIQKPNETPEKPAVFTTPMKIKPPNNHNTQSIPDVSTQTSEQQNKTSTQNTTSSRKVAGSQTDQTSKPPPLVQQLFDRARRAEEKKEKVNSVWYTSQLLRYFSQSRFGIPKYKYTLDEKTGLITARIMVENSKVYTGDPCVSHEQATESVAKKVYEALNLNKAPDAKMVMAPRQQWYNSQPNTWVQNVRHPAMPMSLPKIPPIPQSLPMQRNTFYPRWNQNLPSTAAFVQTTLYQNQNRHAQQGQQQMKQQGHQQAKYQAKQGQQKNSQREEPRVEIRNSTAFVPLQAQKNSRNLSARQTSKEADTTAKNSSPKVQQRQKKEETPKREKPENANKAKVKEATSSVQPQQQVSQQPQQNTGKLSKPRKSRVAAKFGAQPLMNGGEPSK